MTVSFDLEEKPLIGFFPPFLSLADAGRLVMIAKRYRELGGKAIFFSHGGQHEYLAKENGFSIIRVNPIQSEEEIENFWSLLRDPKLKKSMNQSILSKKWVEENVRNEIEAFKQTGIKMLVSAYIPTCSISTRVVKIPYVSIVNDMGYFNIQAPDIFEIFLTRRIPQHLKIRFVNWYFQRTKIFLRPFNKVAKKFCVPLFKRSNHALYGDFTFETNVLEFINIFPDQQRFSTENYIGPILLDELFATKTSEEETKQIEYEIKSHLAGLDRSIFVNLGSVGHEELFLRVLRVLNKTKYRIICLYTKPLNKNELSKLNDNILLKKFLPSIEKVHRMVDLAIIHGGQGTAYTAAYAGKPIIGIPAQLEQHRNVEKFVGHGAGLILSKKYFSKEKLLASINEVFSNYKKYLAKAKNLANKLPPPEGDKNAVRRIIEIQNLYKNQYPVEKQV